jgi:hypothetical protein
MRKAMGLAKAQPVGADGIFRSYNKPWRSLSNLYALPLTLAASVRSFDHGDGRSPIRSRQNSLTKRPRCQEARMPVYHAYIVGSHSRFIGAVRMDCADDDSAIKSAGGLVDTHDVELWQMDRPVVRFDAESKQMFRKPAEAGS